MDFSLALNVVDLEEFAIQMIGARSKATKWHLGTSVHSAVKRDAEQESIVPHNTVESSASGNKSVLTTKTLIS